MPRKRHTAEQIIGLLRQAEVELAQGRTVGEICRRLEVSEATFYLYGLLPLRKRPVGWV
jgi:DNA-binding NarL/FixJ family response regulator